jgi:hypothetical protein
MVPVTVAVFTCATAVPQMSHVNSNATQPAAPAIRLFFDVVCSALNRLRVQLVIR